MQGLDFSEIDRPEDFDGTAPVPEGDVHAMISAVEDNPVDKNGNPIDGMRVTFTVAAHSQPGQVNRQHKETFWNPNGPEPYPGARKSRLALIGKLAIATGLVSREQLVGNPNVQINWQLLVGKQVCMRLKKRTQDKKDPHTGAVVSTNTYINIDDRACAIYSPIEDAAKNFPKNPQLFKMLPPETLRQASPELLQKMGIAGGAPAAPAFQQQPQQQPTAPVSLPPTQQQSFASTPQSAAPAAATGWNNL